MALSSLQIRILIAVTIGLALGYSNLAVTTFGLFVSPLADLYGWGRQDISTAASIMLLCALVAAPMGGWLADRYGAKPVVMLSSVFLAIAFAVAGLAGDSLAIFYVAYAAIALGGMGTMPPCYTRNIVRHFDAGRGFALGISLAGIGVIAAFLPPLVSTVIHAYGVKGAYFLLAGLSLIPFFIVYRMLLSAPAARESLSIRQESELRLFSAAGAWNRLLRIALVALLLGLFTGATWTNMTPLLLDKGMSNGGAALTMSVLAASMTVSRVITGFLLDKIHVKVVAAIFLSPVVIALFILASGVQGVYAAFCVAVIGIGIGAEFDIVSYAISRYLPNAYYGRLFGVCYSMVALGSALGARLFGGVFDLTGDYGLALFIVTLTTGLAILILQTFGAYPAHTAT